MITETLTGSGDLNLQAVNFRLSSKKVVFTTLYVDIKEPTAPARFSPQKNPTPSPISSAFAKSYGAINRDKIEFQFAVPKYARTQLAPAFARGVPLSAGSAK